MFLAAIISLETQGFPKQSIYYFSGIRGSSPDGKFHPVAPSSLNQEKSSIWACLTQVRQRQGQGFISVELAQEMAQGNQPQGNSQSLMAHRVSLPAFSEQAPTSTVCLFQINFLYQGTMAVMVCWEKPQSPTQPPAKHKPWKACLSHRQRLSQHHLLQQLR